MKKISALLFVLIAVSVFKINTVKTQVNVQDSLALVDLYNSTNGPHWQHRDGWTGKSPVSTWYGVTVTANRVTDLNLRINGLTGTIPSSIGNLTALKNLDFYDNQLTGSIPVSMGNLINLESLDLEFNYLSGGDISTFKNLTKLSFLDLNGCGLTGTISFLAKLTNPQGIYLSSNKLTGKIPVMNCANLAVLELHYNQLSGNIPVFKKDTANLYGEYGVTILLDHNNLSGNINKFDSIVHLAELDLENNKFTFAGMENMVSTFPFAVYSPQANINIQQSGNVLKVVAGGTLSNNTYKWYKNGVLFKTKTGNASLTVNGNGNYSVAVTNSIATKLTLYSDTIFYAGLTSNISQANTQNNFSTITAYPNPVNKIVTITFKATGKYSITINDFSGKKLQIKTCIASKEINTVQLDVNKYATGVYFITIKDENNHQQTIRLKKE